MTQRTLSKLSRSECNSLMRGRRVGRLAYCDSLGPVAVPVNFALAGDDIVIRMEPTNTAIQMGQSLVAFETDHVDETSGEGWSRTLECSECKAERQRKARLADRER